MTLKSGCGVWKKMLPKWRWEMVMQLIAGLSREMFILSMLVKVVGSTEDKEDHSFLEIPSTGYSGYIYLNLIISMIKKSEIDELLAFLNGLKIARLLACWWAELSILDWSKAAANQTVDLTNLKEVVKMTKKGGDRQFHPNYAWPNVNHAPGKQHACNDSVPERQWWTPLDGCSDHYHQGC